MMCGHHEVCFIDINQQDPEQGSDCADVEQVECKNEKPSLARRHT